MTTPTNANANANAFLDILKKRRSQYALGSDLPLPQAEVTALIQEAIRQSPSSFNSQSSRALILYGTHHTRFWSIVMDALRKLVPAADFPKTEQKINAFAAGAGTVLFYEDQNVVADLQQKFPLYAEKFPVWSEHSTGIAQFAVWSTLAAAGIGASLQHYNPLVDEAAAAEWNVPETWTLCAQMPFGSHQGDFADKSFMPDAERFRIFS